MRAHLRQDSFAKALIDRYCDPALVFFPEGDPRAKKPAESCVKQGTLIFQFPKAPAAALSYLVAHEIAHVVAATDRNLFKANFGLPDQNLIENNSKLVTCRVGRAAELQTIVWHSTLMRTYYKRADLEGQLETLIVGGGMVFGATACDALGLTPEVAQAEFIEEVHGYIASGNYSIEAFDKEWDRKLALIRTK
jgi:hypothetical protein